MSEKRFETRIPTDFESSAWKGEGEIENLGAGGLFVRATAIPERWEKIWVSFRAPNGDEVRVGGVVWWTTTSHQEPGRNSPGFGVRLAWASETYQSLLKQLSGQP